MMMFVTPRNFPALARISHDLALAPATARSGDHAGLRTCSVAAVARPCSYQVTASAAPPPAFISQYRINSCFESKSQLETFAQRTPLVWRIICMRGPCCRKCLPDSAPAPAPFKSELALIHLQTASSIPALKLVHSSISASFLSSFRACPARHPSLRPLLRSSARFFHTTRLI